MVSSPLGKKPVLSFLLHFSIFLAKLHEFRTRMATQWALTQELNPGHWISPKHCQVKALNHQVPRAKYTQKRFVHPLKFVLETSVPKNKTSFQVWTNIINVFTSRILKLQNLFFFFLFCIIPRVYYRHCIQWSRLVVIGELYGMPRITTKSCVW